MIEQRLQIAADAYVKWCSDQPTMPHVNELAIRLGLSVTRFSNDFLKEVGVRPSTYLKTHHVLNTIRLIRATDLDYRTIARLTGFGSRTTMFRTIRRVTGRTAEYFREHRDVTLSFETLVERTPKWRKRRKRRRRSSTRTRSAKGSTIER